MSKCIFFNSYKLKKGVNIDDFLMAAKKLNNEHISKQKGYISYEITVDGENWADFTIFETLKDAKSFAEINSPNDVAKKFYSFINFNTCVTRFFESVSI